VTRVAFVCVQNAGRSQMAAAFAEREATRRDLEVDVLTGGTDPAEEVHPGVVDAMREVGVDVADRTPREVSTADLQRCDLVATMGCSTLSLEGVETRDWDLPDPDGESAERVREIRETVRERVAALFDDLEAGAETGPPRAGDRD